MFSRTLFLAVIVLQVATAHAAIIVDLSPGTSAPPGTLGPFSMTAFPDDPRGNGSSVSSVSSPLGGSVGFAPNVTLLEIGSGWATWSHGYTGDVYDTGPGGNSLTLTLPANTGAFYFYAEPAVASSFNFEAVAQDGTSTGLIPISGASGARYIGFYGTAGSIVSTISITADPGADGFAVGEFGIAAGQQEPIAIPEPSTLALLGFCAIGLGIRARHRRKAA